LNIKQQKIQELIEFLADMDDILSIEDYSDVENEEQLEIYSDSDFDFPSGIKYLESLGYITIEAPITKLTEDLLKLKSLEGINIVETEINNIEQVSKKFFEKNNLTIEFNSNVYKSSPWSIGKGVFGFQYGNVIFSSDNDEKITIPTFIHEDYGVYPGSADILVKDFKKVLSGDLDLEKAKSFSSNGIYGEGDLLFDAKYSANRDEHWTWRSETPTHFVDE